MKRITRAIKNKYVLSSLTFVLWMTFFDNNDVFRHIRHQRILNDLNREKRELVARISDVERQMNELKSKDLLEKFAREQYYFKRPNEEVFVIVAEEK